MASQSKDSNETEKLMEFQGTRRDFFKVLSAVAAGGVALSLPNISGAESLSRGQGFTGLGSWQAVQDQFMLDDLIYLNTGTEGSMPRTVFDSFCDFTKRFTINPWNAINNDADLNIFQTQNRQN